MDEARSLYGLDPNDDSYTVHIDDDGQSTITFGDGEQGKATYRAKQYSGYLSSRTGPSGQLPVEIQSVLVKNLAHLELLM